MLRVNHLSGFGRRKVSGGPTDSDATAFLVASANDGDPTISAAINTLVIALKAAGVWTKCNAIYPVVGGTAAKHKWNLKDPQDTDGAFRLTFTGSWTHAAGGMTAGANPSYADTKLQPSTVLSTSNTHLASYACTNTNTGPTDLGAHGNSNNNVMYHYSRSGGNFQAVHSQTAGAAEYITVASSDSRGFWVSSRRSASDFEAYKNGSSIGTYTSASTVALPTETIWLADRNLNGSAYGTPSDKQYAFFSIGASLTDTEVADYYTAVQAFQTTLGRNV